MVGSYKALDRIDASSVLNVDNCFTNAQLRKTRFPLPGREIERDVKMTASNRGPRDIHGYHCRIVLWFRRTRKIECTRRNCAWSSRPAARGMSEVVATVLPQRCLDEHITSVRRSVVFVNCNAHLLSTRGCISSCFLRSFFTVDWRCCDLGRSKPLLDNSLPVCK